MSERVPVGVPRSVAPSASHESSITLRSWASAMARIRSQSGALPMRFGARIALVRGEIIASMPSTSMLNVSGSTSTNAGTIPARTSGAMSVENVTAAVTISSPGSHPSSSMARYRADEPELHMMPRRFPKYAATPCSNALTFLLIRSAEGPPRRTSTTASISSSPCTLPAYSIRRWSGLTSCSPA